MSRMTTSSASFPWARAPMRRARSSDVKRPKCSPESARIEVAFPDQGPDGRRDELVDGAAGPDSRGRDGTRVDVEEADALGPGKAREHRLEPLPREARPRPDAELGELENRVRLGPGEEVAELVRADDEQRVVEVLG